MIRFHPFMKNFLHPMAMAAASACLLSCSSLQGSQPAGREPNSEQIAD
jgi:hypothetical protein